LTLAGKPAEPPAPYPPVAALKKAVINSDPGEGEAGGGEGIYDVFIPRRASSDSRLLVSRPTLSKIDALSYFSTLVKS